MSEFITVILIMIMSYVIGNFNLSYFLSKLKGYDIRQHGSGNAGASNVVIMMGKKAGIIVALTDIFKAFLVCTLAMKILGHIFPFYMNFRGGKGLASLGGTILALDPKMFVVLLAIAVVLAVVTNYICVVPMSISVVFAIVYGYTRQSIASFLILMMAAVVINLKHIENIKRIKAGTEAHFSLLWDRKSEAERLGKVYDGEKGYEKVEEIN